MGHCLACRIRGLHAIFSDGKTQTLDWHAAEAIHVAAHLHLHLHLHLTRGLDEVEASARVAIHGRNRPSVRRGLGPFFRFLAEFSQPLLLVLIAAGTVTVFLREWVDVGVIFGVVLVNAVVGFIQEGKAEAALAALVRIVAVEVTVLRGGDRWTVAGDPTEGALLAAARKGALDQTRLDAVFPRIDGRPF